MTLSLPDCLGGPYVILSLSKHDLIDI